MLAEQSRLTRPGFRVTRRAMIRKLQDRTLACAALATLGHAALLGGASVFQFAGYAPCAMCIWQRWPHAAAIALGLLALLRVAPRAMCGLALIAAATASGLGVFHAGVEQGWWPGPSSCTGGGASLGGLSGEDLLSMERADAIVLCDDIVWQWGLTMAGWNALLSAALVVVWAVAWLHARPAPSRLSA